MASRFLDVLRFLVTGSNPGSTTEGDAWYRSDLGQLTGDVGANLAPLNSQFGSHPLPVKGTSDAWYPLQPGGGAHSSAGVTDNRPYTYPIYPGRKTTLTGIRARVSVAVAAGNIRAVLWNASATTGLPDTLHTDYGTVLATSVGTVAWAPNTALETIPYWLSIIPQTGLALSMSRYTTFNPMIPWIASTPAMGTSDWWNCIYGAGIAGAPPASFGSVSGIEFGPHVMVKLS